MDFEDSVLHDKAWLQSQPDGTVAHYVAPKDTGAGIHTTLALSPGEGVGGSNALLVESDVGHRELNSFWVLKHKSQNGNIANLTDEQGYYLPRGQQANRLEMMVRFEPGFRAESAALPGQYPNLVNFEFGTYHFDPGKLAPGKNVNETDNWHFYHSQWVRHDLAQGNWIRVVANVTPQHIRSINAGVPVNPTGAQGNYWELLTRFYVDLTPYGDDPETGYPSKMWVDNIKLTYAPEPKQLEVKIEGFVNGQDVNVVTDTPRDFDVTITNHSTTQFDGTLAKRAIWSMTQELLDSDGQPVSVNLSLAPGASLSFVMRVAPKTNVGLNIPHYVGIAVVPNDQLTEGNNESHADQNVEQRRFAEQGPSDAHLYGAFVKVSATDVYVNDVPSVVGGVTHTTAIDAILTGQISASDPEAAALTYSVVEAPANGTLSINAATGSFTFSPDPGFSGLDSFKYKVSDGTTESRVALSWVLVGGVSVVANDDQTEVNSHLHPTDINVLANDEGGVSIDPARVQVGGTASVGEPLVVSGEGTWSVNSARANSQRTVAGRSSENLRNAKQGVVPAPIQTAACYRSIDATPSD